MFCNYCGTKKKFTEHSFPVVISVYPTVTLCHEHYRTYATLRDTREYTITTYEELLFCSWLVTIGVLAIKPITLKKENAQPGNILPGSRQNEISFYNYNEIFKDFS